MTYSQVRVPRNGGSRGGGEYGHEVSILSRPPSVFWFLFHVEKELAPLEKELAPQGETLQNGAPSRGPGQLLLPLRGNSPSRALRGDRNLHPHPPFWDTFTRGES